MEAKNIPYGLTDFARIQGMNYYYVDKTLFIRDVLKQKVALYTRPRRFHRNSVDTFGIRQEAR